MGIEVTHLEKMGRRFMVVETANDIASLAEVSTRIELADGELVRPSTLQFIWTHPNYRGHGFAGLLIRRVLELYPDLSHDGHLSQAGQGLVDGHSIPMRSDAEPMTYDADEAERLGFEIHVFISSRD